MRSFLALAMLSASFAVAEEKPVEIPLKSIWAHGMPDTRNIRAADSPKAEDSIVEKALQQVRKSWDHDKGMAVQGEGLTAVEEFYRIRTENLPKNEVSADSSVSLVFFTAPVGFYTHVRRVERRGNRFTIQYRFEPHQTRDITQHFAVIPIGKVLPGKYEVNIEQLPLQKQYIDLGYEKLLPDKTSSVCKSFSFLVREPKAQEAAAKSVEIPLKDVWSNGMPCTRNIRENIRELDVSEAEQSIVTKAIRQVGRSWDRDKGMAVQGEGLEAVEELYLIRTEKLSRNEVLTDAPISLVFYTAPVGLHTHIQRIEKRGNDFTISYRFVPDGNNRGMTQYLALIPVGTLPSGKYKVKVKQLPLKKQYLDLGYQKMLPRQLESVCKSFSFVVREPEVQQ